MSTSDINNTDNAAEPIVYPLVGGTRHGETITLAPDITSWTDLLTASTYYQRPIIAVDNGVSPPQRWRQDVFAHESIAMDTTVIMQAVTSFVMRDWMRTGTLIPPEEGPTVPPPVQQVPMSPELIEEIRKRGLPS